VQSILDYPEGIFNVDNGLTIYFANDSVKAAEWSILYSIARRLNLRGLLKDIQDPDGWELSRK
jgi:hypothetical protein